VRGYGRGEAALCRTGSSSRQARLRVVGRAGGQAGGPARLGAAVGAAQVDEVEHLRAAQRRRARLLLQHRVHKLRDARGHRRPLWLPAGPQPPQSGAVPARGRRLPQVAWTAFARLTDCSLPARVAHMGQVGAGRRCPGLN